MDETLNKGDIKITRENRWFGFQLLVIFIVLTIGIGASGYFYYKTQEKQLRDATNDQLSAVADLKVKQIVAWRDDQIENATIILKQSPFVPFVHQWLANPTDSILKEKVSAWMNIFLEDKNYKSIFLADAQGNARLSLPQRDQQLSDCIKPHFAEALRTKKIIFTDFHFVATTRQIHLALIIPLFDSNAAPSGFIVLEIDPYQFLYPLIQTWPTPSKTAETLLVRREGNEVVFLNELRHRKNTALTFRLPISRKNLPAVMAIEGKTGIVEGVDYRGKPVIATVRANSDSSWYLVAKIDVSEINASIEERTQFVAIIVALLIALSGTGFGLLWRHQRSQFYKKQYETERKMAIELKQAEEALRESEKRLRVFLQNSAVVGWMKDEDGRYVFMSENFQNRFGVHFEDCQGKKDFDLWPRNFAETFRRNDLTVLNSGRSLEGIEGVPNPDGSLSWWWDNKFLFQDETGKRFVGGLGVDITDRKKLEDNLKNEHQELKLIIDSSPIIVFYKDKEGKFLRVNKTFAEALKLPEEEFVGKTVFDFYSTKIAQDMTNDDQGVLKSGRPKINIIEQYESVSGIKWVQTDKIPICDKNGIPFGIIGFSQDITERKRTEEAVHESEGKYRALIETTNTGYVILDLTGKVLDANDEYARLTGYERRDEILGRSVVEWTASYDRERNAKAVENCFRQGFVRNLELDYVGHQGQTIPIEGNATLVTTESGPQILALCRDITDRKKAEKEREKLIVELRASLEKVKTLSGLLPICASCKKIRDDKGYWNQIDSYIREHSEAEFTHGICPECMKKLYPDFEIVE